jgi:uncharacterized protein YggE
VTEQAGDRRPEAEGVTPGDIRETGMNVASFYDADLPLKIAGYRASHDLRVLIRHGDRARAILGAAGKAMAAR